jgi:hypothetical protein
MEATGHYHQPSGKYLFPTLLTATGLHLKQKKKKNPGHSVGHGNGALPYCAYHPIKEIQGFTISHWTPPLGKHSLQQHQLDMPMPFFMKFFIITLSKKATR